LITIQNDPTVKEIPIYFCPECLNPGYNATGVVSCVTSNPLGTTFKPILNEKHEKYCPNGCGIKVTTILVPKDLFITTTKTLLERLSKQDDINLALVIASIILAKNNLAKPDLNPHNLYQKALANYPALTCTVNTLLLNHKNSNNLTAITALNYLSQIVTKFGILGTGRLLELFNDTPCITITFCGDCLEPGVDIKPTNFTTLSLTNEPLQICPPDDAESECPSCGSSNIVDITLPKHVYVDLLLKLLDNLQDKDNLDKAIIIGTLLLLKQKLVDHPKINPDELLDVARENNPELLNEVEKILQVTAKAKPS
jgi:hypothetical protein